MFRPALSASRNFYRVFMLILAVVALGACGTEAQKRADTISKTNNAAAEALLTCIDAAYSLPAFDAARRRLPIDLAQATLEQETDPSIAKDAEIAAVLQAHPKLEVCRKTFLDRITEKTPSLVPAYALIFTVSESSLIEVMQKKKSWGDHVHDVKELQKKAGIEIVAETKNIADGLSQDPKAVQARKEAAEKSVAVYQQTQKTMASLRRPIITKTN